MSNHDFHTISFPKVDFDTWKSEVDRTLKGKSYEKLLVSTYENITLKPIYTKEDTKHLPHMDELPGFGGYVRGTSSSGYSNNPWLVGQELDTNNVEEFNKQLKEAVQHGQTMINFKITDTMDVHKAFDGISISTLPFLVDVGEDSTSFLNSLESYFQKNNLKIHDLKGTVGMDPLGFLSEHGYLLEDLKTYYDKMADSIHWAKKHKTNLRTIYIKGYPYHNGGGNAIQELACTFATANEYINALLDRGFTIDDISSRITFGFSIGSNVFMEIAKLRAARIIWSTIINAYGGNDSSRKINIHARTSSFTKTIFDPYVNMLRSTIEGFSAVIGGVNSLQISTFDEPISKSSAFSRRIAKNTHYILKDEAYLDRVIDPAGGSWYVESLTNEIANKTWELFTLIEEKGGMYQALQSGFVQDELRKTLEERQTNVNTRKDKIVGTNMYANLSEKLLFETEDLRDVTVDNKNFAVTITKIPQVRLTEHFEKLRIASGNYKKLTGALPTIGLINIGPIPSHKARADFITGFFEAGGFKIVKNDGYHSTEEAIEASIATGLSTFVLCGSDEDYLTLASGIVKGLKEQNPNIRIYMAGKQNEELSKTLKDDGLTDFIHIKTNCFEFLRQLQLEMGVSHYE